MDYSLPVIDITEDNFEKWYPAISSAVKNASFIAVDCELSGIGDTKMLSKTDVDIRYEYLRKISKSYSIISLGIACFSNTSISEVALSDCGQKICTHDYMTQIFNILTLCKNGFSIDVSAVKFLLCHGFDFNKQYSKGIQFKHGYRNKEVNQLQLHDVFALLLIHKKPLVVHNGLLDLIYLYQSFYADLPKSTDCFAADLCDMFPGGIYDTKYIAEITQLFPASYLEFVFKKMQIFNDKRSKSSEWHVRMSFPPYPDTLECLQRHPFSNAYMSENKEDDGLEICLEYAYHGGCKSNQCNNSHNIDKIVKNLSSKNTYSDTQGSYYYGAYGSLHSVLSTLRKYESDGIYKDLDSSLDFNKTFENYTDTGENCSRDKKRKIICTPESKKRNKLSIGSYKSRPECAGHRAGFDAFMTGYILASLVSCIGILKPNSTFSSEEIGLQEHVNKVYLSGKDFPFLVRIGAYAKCSSAHSELIQLIRR